MANKKKSIIKLVSTGEKNGRRTGYYKTTKNSSDEKLSLKKYDPVLRKYVLFKQEKVK